MGKERMDRREFLLLGFDAAAVAGIALFTGPRFYPFLGLLNRPERGSISPEDFVGLVKTEEAEVYLEHIGKKKVSLNKEVFAQALYDVSLLMLPDGGPEKLYSVLARKPLEVVFPPFDCGPEIVNGEDIWVAGRYEKYFDFGPKISFYPLFLTDYYLVQGLSGAALSQMGQDTIIFHEIAHLVQDLRNPLANPFPNIEFKIKRAGSKLDLVEDPDKWSLPHEMEAKEIGARMAQIGHARYISDLDYPWPFGKFFIFS